MRNSRQRDSPTALDSGILVNVGRTSISFLFILTVAAAGALFARPQSTSPPAGAGAAQATPQPLAQPPAQPPSPTGQAPVAPPAPQPVTPHLAVVVLDPAHGGADQGARGSWGIAESDVVLSYARLVRISLEEQGLRVILTRQANEDPSFDDRSKLANAQHGDIFISLHVSSTGQPGTVRVYSLPQAATASVPPHTGLISWDHAQSGYRDLSQRLAELIQIQMAQNFHGSPEIPLPAAVRQLRTIAAPAVAIEVSSVSVQDRGPLDKMGPALGDAVARAVAAFRIVYESGGK